MCAKIVKCFRWKYLFSFSASVFSYICRMILVYVYYWKFISLRRWQIGCNTLLTTSTFCWSIHRLQFFTFYSACTYEFQRYRRCRGLAYLTVWKHSSAQNKSVLYRRANNTCNRHCAGRIWKIACYKKVSALWVIMNYVISERCETKGG